MTTDPTCVFCKIVAGDIPSRRVYADDHAYAFLDVAPWHPGHTLVVPRRHVPDLITDDPALTEIAPAIQTVSRLLVDRLEADGLNLVSSSGSVAGQEVFHLHVHLVPRYASAPGGANLVNPHRVDDAELEGVHRRVTGSA